MSTCYRELSMISWDYLMRIVNKRPQKGISGINVHLWWIDAQILNTIYAHAKCSFIIFVSLHFVFNQFLFICRAIWIDTHNLSKQESMKLMYFEQCKRINMNEIRITSTSSIQIYVHPMKWYCILMTRQWYTCTGSSNPLSTSQLCWHASNMHVSHSNFKLFGN